MSKALRKWSGGGGVPADGAVGRVVDYRLIDSLSTTAMNAYRMRWLDDLAQKKRPPSDCNPL